MLKKIITSILIPDFLLQIAGCYSQKAIAAYELKNHEEDEIKLITKDSKEYSARYDGKYGKSLWAIDGSNINVMSKRLVKYSPNFF